MSTHDPNYTGKFHDAYGLHEWNRLETTAYGRLQAIIHADLIRSYIGQGNRVLDSGCGPGRFTAEAAKLGANVTALDISRGQLELAEKKIREAGLLQAIDAFTLGDVVDLSTFPDGQFDAVICYGGPLSYVCDQRHKVASELVRIVRPGGILLASVMSRYGTMVNWVRSPTMPFLRDPEGLRVSRLAEDGNLSGVPSAQVNMQHPKMHLYTSDELRNLLPHCHTVELVGSNVMAVEGSSVLDEVSKVSEAWATAVTLERKLNNSPGLVDSGSHIIMVARRGS